MKVIRTIVNIIAAIIVIITIIAIAGILLAFIHESIRQYHEQISVVLLAVFVICLICWAFHRVFKN